MAMLDQNIRLRYAPSPTGDPHVGNIRTAIFNWLCARHYGGSLIIRVEDTDQSRKVEGATEELLEALKWLGLDWEEGPDIGGPFGPYYQSERLEHYREAADRLMENGDAYRCYCSPERIAEVRKDQARLKQPLGYDRRCLRLSSTQRAEHESTGVVPVVRFKMPEDGITTVDDLVRGEVSFQNGLIDDFVVLKSDGFPTYHLAALVDDHLMRITHVMRAEEWLPSVPRHLQLYRALGWDPPRFAHLPIILAPDRSKLGKRHGATSILEYREQGFLPEAMVNFLTLLGWSLDDRTELLSVPELVRHFTIDRVAKSAAVFNLDKLSWMNGHYIRQLEDDVLADALLEHWRRYPPQEISELPDKSYLVRIVPIIRERLKTLADAAPLIRFFFTDDVEYDSDELVQKGMDAAATRQALSAALVELEELSPFDADTLEGVLRPMAEDLNVKVGQLFGSLRVATTGLRVAPPLFQTMELLGKERTLASIHKAMAKL